MKPASPLSQILHAVLLASLIAPPFARAEDPGTTSMATSTLQGMTGALNGINGMFTSFGQSSAQLQSMAAQLMGAQQQAQGQQQPQSQFDQIQKNLSLAVAEANACVTQASTESYDKYYSARNAKDKDTVKKLPPQALTSVEPTCTTYGVILDAIQLNKARMANTRKKLACMTNLQNKINQIASAAKAPFQQLNNAALEVYKTYSNIIDSHQKIADKIADDVDGPADKDGKRSGGYRAELGKLKGMALELNNVLNAKPGENQDKLKYGLVKQVENLKQQRVSAANKWYFTLMEDVEHCYHTEPAPCFDNDVSLPPDQCIAAMVANQGVGQKGAGTRVRAKTDAQGLANIGLKNYMSAQKVNLPANIDVSKPDELLSFTQIRFQETLKGVLGVYRTHQFSSNVDKTKVTNFVNDAYRACYDKAVSTFKSDMISKGGRYYQDLQAMQDSERETANDVKNWIDRVEGEMTEFRTQFHKVYNSELAQFKSDCTSDEDPYKGLDCLRVLNTELQSGMRGTRVSTKLGNGSTFTSMAGETSLPIQTLTLDASGKPSIGNSSVQCSGFDDCINYLDRARADHASAAQKTSDDRKKFVEQHNAAVKSSFAIVASQFGTVSQLLTSGVKGVNDDLATLGIKGAVKTKQTEPEELKENEKTGMYDMPKSMKAALAGENSYTEIEDTADVDSAMSTLETDLNKKAGDSMKMKRQCQVDNAAYKTLLGVMPTDCSNTQLVCERERVTQAASALDPILKRSMEKPDDASNAQRLPGMSEYKQCAAEIKAEANANLQDDQKLAELGASLNPPIDIFRHDKDHEGEINLQKKAQVVAKMKAQNAAGIRKDTRQDCADNILNALSASAANDRDALRQQNVDIVEALKAVTAACGDVETDDKGKMIQSEDVTTKCEAFKTLAKDAKAPTGEAETGLAGSSSTGSKSSDPFSGTAK